MQTTFATPRRPVSTDIKRVVFATVAILLIPLVAMQFTSEVAWGVFDFVVAGVLLAGTGLAYVGLSRKASQKGQRLVIGLVLVAVLLLVWAELAVGVFGTPFAGT